MRKSGINKLKMLTKSGNKKKKKHTQRCHFLGQVQSRLNKHVLRKKKERITEINVLSIFIHSKVDVFNLILLINSFIDRN